MRITDRKLVNELMQTLNMQLHDNVNASVMKPDGSYAKVKRMEGQAAIDSQLGMYDMLKTAWPEMPTEAFVPQEVRTERVKVRAVRRRKTQP